MPVLTLTTRALMLLAALATTGAMAHPADTSINPCSTVRCAIGTTCSLVDGKPQCIPTRVPCGNTVCAAGLYCCNASCGMCVKPGMMCTQHVCDPSLVPSGSSSSVATTPSPTPSSPATGPQCGKTLCAAGLVCCNASCGICAPPDGACTAQFCESS